LNNCYDQQGISFCIQKIANGYLFATKPENAKYVGYLSSEKSKRRLSQAALETLAIIAYNSLLLSLNLKNIRGVNSDYILQPFLRKTL